MEAATLAMLTLGFAMVILISVIVIIMLWFKVKSKAFGWFLVQIVLLCAVFFNFIKLLIMNSNIPKAMVSEENSLALGIIGVLWACSMLCMLIGIYWLSKEKIKDEERVRNKEEYTPGFKNALWVILFYGLLCPIFLSIITVAASKVIGFSEKDPLVLVVTTIGGFGFLVLWLRRKHIINLQSMFSMKNTSVIFFIPMILIISGLGILLSEVSNLTTRILPMSDSWVKAFSSVLGDDSAPWKGILAVVVVAPIVEEIIFRGMILRGFLKHYSVRKSIFLSALLFGIVHMNPWQFVTAFVAGIILGWWYVKTESIITTIFGHALNNGMNFIIGAIGLSIPGYNVPYDTAMHQPVWFDLLGIILLAGGIVWLVKLFNARKVSTEKTITNS
jgi:membrane protease YdiL (CAAX protease family)